MEQVEVQDDIALEAEAEGNPELNFDPLEMAGIGALSVLPGVIAHVVEEIRAGVPLRVIPDELGSKYIGAPERHVPEEYQRLR